MIGLVGDGHVYSVKVNVAAAHCSEYVLLLQEDAGI